MQAHEINPYIRYTDLRLRPASYQTPVVAYDYRLFALKEGECIFRSENSEIKLGKDACLIIPPGCPYRLLFQEQAPAALFNINFSLSYLPGNGRPLRPSAPEFFHPEHMPEPPDPDFFPIPTLIENAPETTEMIARLIQERERREKYCDETCSAMLKCILLQLLRLPGAGERSVPAPVLQVKEYLEAHCRESISGEQLGRLFGYHPFYLNRLFRRYTGQTIHLYQMQCRMRAACTLLSASPMSIREIADSLGFSSPSYFSELFRKLRGVSPAEYRSGMR